MVVWSGNLLIVIPLQVIQLYSTLPWIVAIILTEKTSSSHNIGKFKSTRKPDKILSTLHCKPEKTQKLRKSEADGWRLYGQVDNIGNKLGLSCAMLRFICASQLSLDGEKPLK